MKKRKKLTLHKETLKEIQHREVAAGILEDTTLSPTLYPTEVWSSCPPCD